jgi:hypothetical protein
MEEDSKMDNPVADKHTIQGYAPLASLMAEHPEYGIFRKFSSLNAQNLLYLQAELVYLEANLLRHVATDHEAGMSAQNGTMQANKLRYEVDWYSLAYSEEEDPNTLQWKTVLLIREKLKEYSMFLSNLLYCHTVILGPLMGRVWLS